MFEKRTQDEEWDKIYEAEGSSRYHIEGDTGIYYKQPKFVEFFNKHHPSVEGMKILEIGGGGGNSRRKISNCHEKHILHRP